MRRERRTNGKRHKGEQGVKNRERERETSRYVKGLGVGLLEQSGAVPAANRANSGRQMKTNAANLVAGVPTPSH